MHVDLTNVEVLELRVAHASIPDVEILDKLLSDDTVLLTKDRVLHNQAKAGGFHSWTWNEQSELTCEELPGIQMKTMPESTHSELLDRYNTHGSELYEAFAFNMSEKRRETKRTARRRIRSYFGSADGILRASVTLAATSVKDGLLCGIELNLQAKASGLEGLRASESYGIVANGPDCWTPLLFAFREIFLLHLRHVPVDVFVIPTSTLDATKELAKHAAKSDTGMAVQFCLSDMALVTFSPCAKGPFFDRLQRKLRSLSAGRSNEVVAWDPIPTIRMLAELKSHSKPFGT